MVKADIAGYIEILGFFHDEEAETEEDAIRTKIVEEQCEPASSHKLDAMHDEGILDRWQKGNGKPYPVKELSGDRIDGDTAESIVDRWFPDLVEELRESDKLKDVENELDEKEFEELADKSENGQLPEKVNAYKTLLEAIREAEVELETQWTEIGFRTPSYRWYLEDYYFDLFK